VGGHGSVRRRGRVERSPRLSFPEVQRKDLSSETSYFSVVIFSFRDQRESDILDNAASL